MDDVFGDEEIEAINDGDDLLAEDEVMRTAYYQKICPNIYYELLIVKIGDNTRRRLDCH